MPNMHMRLYALISLCKILSLRNRRLATPSCSARPPPADKERANQGRTGLHLHRQGREIIANLSFMLATILQSPHGSWSGPARHRHQREKSALGSMAGWAQVQSTIVGAMKEITHSLTHSSGSPSLPNHVVQEKDCLSERLGRVICSGFREAYLTLKEHYLWHSRYSFFLYR